MVQLKRRVGKMYSLEFGEETWLGERAMKAPITESDLKRDTAAAID